MTATVNPQHSTNPPLDLHPMQRALALAASARLCARPNPAVGCAITPSPSDFTLLAEGRTGPPGQLHAEAAAIAGARVSLRGATLWVTLEPCNHQGRTGPCTEAIIRAGIATVIYACPDPKNGGAERLRSQGIEVIHDKSHSAAAADIAWFFHLREHRQRPFVFAKIAQSLDGCLATWDNRSQWISAPECRPLTHLLRLQADTMVTGRGTLEADNPQLNPRREYLESIDEAHLDAQLDRERQLIVCGNWKPSHREWYKDLSFSSIHYLEKNHAARDGDQHSDPRITHVATRSDTETLERAISAASSASILLIEAGAKLTSAFLNAGLVDALLVYTAPVFLGENGQRLGLSDTSLPLDERIRWSAAHLPSRGDTQVTLVSKVFDASKVAEAALLT